MIQSIENKICIAGKNEIAVYGLSIALELVDKDNLCVLCNATDDVFDTWQPSFLKAAVEKAKLLLIYLAFVICIFV